jgi:DNA-binding MarR family transcriptional regulator
LTFAKYLRSRLRPHKVTPGQWIFLRALWREEGLSQRELSRRVHTTEPTTVSALRLLERNGLIRRVRNTNDRRTINIFLTPKGRALEDTLLPSVLELNRVATEGLSREEVEDAFRLLNTMQRNVAAKVDDGGE